MQKQFLAWPEDVNGYELNPERGWIELIKPWATENLCKNPSAERNVDLWTGDTNTIGRTTAWQWRGAFAFTYTPASGVNDGAYIDLAATTGQPYTMQVMFKGQAGVAYQVGFSNTSNTVQARKTFVATGQAQWLTVTWVATSTATFRVYVRKNNNSNTAPFYWDAVQIERWAFPTTYADGDMRGYVKERRDFYWTGQPHRSTSVRIAQCAAGGRLMNLNKFMRVLAVIGLGMGPVQNQTSEMAFGGGARYQGTAAMERQFTLGGQLVGESLPELQRSKNELESLIQANRVSPEQPVTLRWTLYDGERAAGASVDIPAVYEGGLEGNVTNLHQQAITLTFSLYLPFMARPQQQGTALNYQGVLDDAEYILRRDENGQWQEIVTSANGSIYKLIFGPNGKLYAVGNFTSIDGIGNTSKIAAWTKADGWAGESDLQISGGAATIYDVLILPDESVLVAGSFTTIGGQSLGNLARVPFGINTPVAYGAPNGVVTGLAFSKGYIYAFGSFTQIGGSSISSMARTLDGVTWSAIPSAPSLSFTINDPILVGKDGSLYFKSGFIGSNQKLYRFNPNTNVWTTIQATGPIYGLGMAPNGDVYYGYWTSPVRLRRYNGVSVEDVISAAMSGPVFGFVGFEPSGLAHVSWNGSGVPILGVTAPNYFQYTGATITYPDIEIPSGANTQVTALAYPQSLDGSLVLAFGNTGAATVAGLTATNNEGTTDAYPRFVFKGPGRLRSVKNLTTGQNMYFDLDLLKGEEAKLQTGPGQVYFESNLRGDITNTLLPGSVAGLFRLQRGGNNISLFMTYTAAEANDGSNQLSAYNLQGVTGTNSDNGKLYVNIVSLGAGNYRVDIYSNSARTALVAQSGSYSAAGTLTISQANASGITGTIAAATPTTADSDIEIEVPVAMMYWDVVHSGVEGTVE